MARGRMINQTIDFDPEFNALSVEAQLLYLRTLAFLDRDGLIIGHPRALLAKVAPLLDLSQGDMIDVITEWVAQGLVIRYAIKVGDVLFFKGFAKNQSGMHYDRESESRFSPPPGWTHGPKGLVKSESAPTPPVETEDSGTESSDTPTETIEDAPIDSGTTPAEVRQESGETPTQIEVKDQDQQELKEQLEDEEEAHARDPRHQAWFETYGAEMPAEIETAIGKELAQCSEDAILYAIRESAGAKKRTFNFLKSCALNYMPPPPTQEISNYAKNGNGRYSVDLPGVIAMPPAPQASAPPAPPMAHDDPWQVALGELMPTLVGVAQSYLKGSYAVDSGELTEDGKPIFDIVVEPRVTTGIDWLTTQAKHAVCRKFGSVLRHPIDIRFVVAQGEPA